MFYKKSLRNIHKVTAWFLNTAMPAFVVMLVLIIVVIVAVQYVSGTIEDRKSNVIARHAREASTRLQTRVDGYEDLLGATRVIVVNGEDRSAKATSWQEFWTLLESEERHNGIKSIGFAEIIPQDDRQAHEVSMREQAGLGTYSIRTDGQKSEYAPITFSAPRDGAATTDAIGYDLFSTEDIQESLEHSRDLEQAEIIDVSGSQLPMFDESQDIDTLLVLPIYRSREALDTVQERRDELLGYTYAAISSQEFFGGLMDDNNPSIYTLHLVAPSKTTLLYRNTGEQIDPGSNELRSATEVISVADKAITVTAINTEPLIPMREVRRPVLTLIAGMILTFFVTAFIYMLTLSRIRRQKESEILDINQAKDELLALASHQLRTPATGVKQYLGMLREGYAGKLSKSQTDLIEQAYDSNERQLTTVNELLFVARLDSGRITLDYESINTKLLLEDIVQEQRPNMKEKKQQVDIRFPDDDIIIAADEGYLRMALENIVGNASKYTAEKGKITIWVTKEQDDVNIHVKDTGVGVSDEDMELLFKKFSRVDNDLSSQVAGTGIGLYLTKKIIEAHGGEITFESKLKKGSTVTVSLPIENASNIEKQLNISQ